MSVSTEGFDSEQKSALVLFGEHLRRLRLAAEMTQEECATKLSYSAQHFGNIETGRRLPQQAFMQRAEELLDDRELLSGLWRLAKDQATPGAQVAEFVDAEARANTIHTYQAHLVPGLLQHPEYIKAVVASVRPPLPPAELDARLALRLSRQDILTGENPPFLWAIVGEAVLHQQIGGSGVVRAQHGHLIDHARMHNVTLQVLPFGAPTSPAMGMSFTALSFRSEPDIVYQDTVTGGHSYRENTDAVARCRAVFDYLREAALAEVDSMALIEQLRERA